MISKKSVLFLPILLILISCSQTNHKSCRLTGHLKNIKDGTILNLLDIDSDSVIQTMLVKDGQFKAEFYLTETRYFAIYSEEYKFNKNTLLIWLENADIIIHGNFENFSNAKVNGSESNKIGEKYNTLTHDYAQAWQKIQNSKDIDNKLNLNLQNKYKSDLINFYSTHNKDYVAFYYLAMEVYQFLSPLNKSDIRNLFNELPEDFKKSSKGDLIQKYISLQNSPKIGDKFVDCILQTPNGLKDSISGHLGKYTLIQFWSSLCQPSRGQIPLLKELYKKYHDNGLNIIGISGDINKSEWQTAIQLDSIPWIHMSDLNGYYNDAFMIYGVKNIPYLLLLNQDGVLLDIDGTNLPNEMKKLFEAKPYIFPN